MCKFGQLLTFFVFVIMAAGHWIRYFMDYSLTFNDFVIPVMWSLPVAIFFTLMAVWIGYEFKCYCKGCKKDGG